MKVIFFGTPLFAASILECLLKHHIEVVAVVTKPDKPQGRNLRLAPPPVKAFVQEHFPNIPLFQPTKVSTPEYEEILRKFSADLFIVVAYGEILKQNILSLPKLNCINVHASLLPKYRGAAPIHRAIINGESETGITIMEMVLALDAGAIIHVEKMKIENQMNVQDVENELKILGCKGLLLSIENFSKGTINKVSQNHENATYASKITSEECQINWDQPAHVIHNQIRGTNPFPGAWCLVKIGQETKRLKIKKSLILNHRSRIPGELIEYGDEGFIVSAKEGAIKIFEVQLEGKKTMTSSEFIRGNPQILMLHNHT